MERDGELAMETKLKAVTALMNAYVFINTIDDLEGTSLYKHDLKRKGSVFRDALIKSWGKHFNELWQGENVNFQLVENSLESIGKELSNMKPSELVFVAENFKSFLSHHGKVRKIVKDNSPSGPGDT